MRINTARFIKTYIYGYVDIVCACLRVFMSAIIAIDQLQMELEFRK